MSEIVFDNNTKQAFDLLPSLIWSTDKDGNCLFVNKAWKKFTNMNLKQARGKGWLSSIHQEDINKFNDSYKDVVEFRFLRSDGTYAAVISSAAKTADGYIGEIVDISDRVEKQRKAERKAERTADFLKAVVEGIPDPIFVKDEQHRWIEGNQAFFEMFNMPKADVLYKSDYEFFPKDEADVFWEKDNQVFESGEVVDNFETFTHGDKTRTFFTRKVAAKDTDGNKILIGAIRDITELEKVKNKLEETVTQLTESNDALERFAYVASHDLQEPLRVVMNYTELLKADYSKELDEKAVAYIDYAFDSAKHMLELINDLLDYGKLNEVVEAEEDVNSLKLIEYVVSNLVDGAKPKNVTITYTGKFPIIKNINPLRISRVVQNLICNATKYHKEGVRPKVTIGCKEVKGFWQFSFKDNGIGIDNSFLNEVFLAFKRLHTQEEYEGTGIGLAICKKIIQGKGGELWAESEVGKGSTFYFTIPKKEGDKVA